MSREGRRRGDETRRGVWPFAAQVGKDVQMVYSFPCWVVLVKTAPAFLLSGSVQSSHNMAFMRLGFSHGAIGLSMFLTSRI